jgi:hypothetical protein
LITLGKIIAADICVNNPDRVPSMVDKEGNPSNLMFEMRLDEQIDEERYHNPEYSEMHFGDVMAIDNKCFCIQQSDLAQVEAIKSYLAAIEEFVKEVMDDLKVIMKGEAPLAEYDYPSLRRSLTFLELHTSVEIRGRSAFRILEGLVIGFFNITNLGTSAVEDTLHQC